jgi:hypothetical protein
VDAAEKDGHSRIGLDIPCYIKGVLVLVGEDGETDDVGVEGEDIVPDPL